MKSFALLIPLIFFMMSCTIDRNDEKDAKYSEKHSECLSHRDKVYEQIKGINGMDKPKNHFGKMDVVENYSLVNIFYSPSKDACIFSAYGIMLSGMKLNWDELPKPNCSDYRFYIFSTSGASEKINQTSPHYKKVKKNGKTELECDYSSITEEYEKTVKQLKK